MNEFKLIVAGSRDFNNPYLLNSVLFAMADVEFAEHNVSIVSGMARGADALGAAFARANYVELYEFPANWDKYGKRAGFIRNEEMAVFSDGLLAFWDGQSKGTAHMISAMKSKGKHVTVINYLGAPYA